MFSRNGIGAGRHTEMQTSISVRNFKQFEDITVDLDDVVVFVGPNDSGKPQLCRPYRCGNWDCADGVNAGA